MISAPRPLGLDFAAKGSALARPFTGSTAMALPALLVISEVRQADSRHCLHIQQLCCLNAPMSGNDLVVVIDQNGVVKAEPLDAVRDLPDLLGRVSAGVTWIGTQRVGRPVFEVHFWFSVE